MTTQPERRADEAKFEAQLKAEGFPEIRRNEYKPNQHNPEHSHPFDVHAMVLDGEITLTVDGKPTRYGVGDEFSMAAGCRHIEDIGPNGVRYLVGRRPRSAVELFAAECKDILTKDPGPAGRQKICSRLEELLRDARFVETAVTDKTPERHILYEDPDLGFCILAHNYTSAKTSPPHDHGPSWAIYGQARGETEMTDYARVAEPADGKPGKARPTRTYKLTPGVAHVYNEKVLHSPTRRGPTQLVRLEGLNMDRIKRDKFETV